MTILRISVCGWIAFAMFLVSVNAAMGQRFAHEHNVIARQFRNHDKKAYGGQGLADFAHEVMILAFSQQAKADTYRFTFIPAAKLEGIRAPDSMNDDFKAAARKLRVDTFIEGDIVFVQITNNSAGILGTVEAGVKIHIRDVRSGDLVNGAAEVGAINFIGVADVSTAETAVENAVKKCVTTIQGSHLPEGIVSNGGKFVYLINRGFNDGVKTGMMFGAYRNGTKVGVIKAAVVFGNDAEIAIVQNTGGIGPQDDLRALYVESRKRLASHYAKAPPAIDLWN